MAFIDALDLASEAGTADVLASAAKPAVSDLATGASQADNIQTVKGLASSVSKSQLDPGATTTLGILPTSLLPFGDPVINIAAFGGMVVTGLILNDRGFNAITTTLILAGMLIIFYFIGKKVFVTKTTATPTGTTSTAQVKS